MGDSQEVLPDTASPSEPIPSSFCGWGRLVPLRCTLPAKDLIDQVYTIGREIRCELSITEYDVKPDIHKQISKIHCRISRQKVGSSVKEVVILEDLSSNGTFVNGKKISKSNPFIIASEDEIAFAAPQNKIFQFVNGAKNDFLPRELTEKYFLADHIGSGGFGDVYLLLNRATNVEYALKKIAKTGVPEQKIFNEINILQKLRHKCIVELVEVKQSEDAAFIVMEYVSGGTLLDRIKRDKRLEEQTCKLVFFQLTWAIDYLHAQGVTHRDIKPENILVKERPDVGPGNLLVVKVADFGLSKIIDSLTYLKTACGTFQYTAPEVLGKKGYSNLVDIWGIGVVLFVCLSGRRPFTANPGDPRKLMSQIMRGCYNVTTPEWSTISQAGKHIVKSLLTVNPAQRIDTEGIFDHPWLKDEELLNDLKKLFGSEVPLPHKSENEENFEPPLKVAKLDISG